MKHITSVYMHIPFCHDICSYCDFCKMYYKKEWIKPYLISLEKEIKNNLPLNKLTTLYIGGGTPSVLEIDELTNLLELTKLFVLDHEAEFTFECNIEQMSEAKLKLLKKYGVNRISYGVQTFNSKYLTFLNRKHTKELAFDVIKLTKKYFNNINVDFMYALKDETVEEVENDIRLFLELDIPHISTYSLIIEPNTLLYNNKVENISEDIDYEMYEVINNILQKNGYNHYEISNFSKPGYESKHNLAYWNNLEYYGYGLGASGYINKVRYTNTRSLNNYIKGNYCLSTTKLSKQDIMQEEMILGLRKINGVSILEFYELYGQNMKDVFKIRNLIEEGKLEETNGFIRIPKDMLYISNEVLISFIGE